MSTEDFPSLSSNGNGNSDLAQSSSGSVDAPSITLQDSGLPIEDDVDLDEVPKKSKKSAQANFDITSEEAFPSLAPSPAPVSGWGKGKGRAGHGTPTSSSAGGWAANTAQRLGAASPTPNGSALGGYGAVSGAPSSASSEVGGPTASGLASAAYAGSGVGSPAQSNVVTYNFTLPTTSIQVTALPNPSRLKQDQVAQPTTVGEVCAWINRRYEGVTVEASSGMGRTTFLLRSRTLPNAKTAAGGHGKGRHHQVPVSGEQARKDAETRLEAARKELLQRISKKESITLQVPSSCKPFIIGAGGRNLKAIIDATGTSIQLPRASDQSSSPAGDADEDPLVPLTITGDHSSVVLARQKILSIVNERTSKTSLRITRESIPTQFWPLLSGPNGDHLREIVSATVGEEEEVNVSVPSIKDLARWARGVTANGGGEEEEEKEGETKRELAIVVSGDKEVVNKVIEALQAAYSDLKRTTKEIKVSLNKRQHRFLVGQNAVEILNSTGCAVSVPSPEDPSDSVTVRGKNAIGGITAVMEKAESAHVDSVDLLTVHRLPSPDEALTYATSVSRYLLRKAKLRKLQEDKNVSIYLPRSEALLATAPNGAANAVIEVVGPNADNVEQARKEVFNVIKSLRPSSFDKVEIDGLVHKFLIGKQGAKVKTYEQTKQVDVLFPNLVGASQDEKSRDEIVLVYSGDGNEAEAKANLQDVKNDLIQTAETVAKLTTQEIRIPQNLHRALIGQNGTTLNAIIGEEKAVSVKFPAPAPRAQQGQQQQANGDAEADKVVVRGPSDEVERVVKELQRVADEAKDFETLNSHTVEFEIESRHVSHIIGKAGSGLNNLREELGVRVDMDEVKAGGDASSAGPARKSAKTSAKTKVTIKGVKKNVEEAKKRIESHSARLADETTVMLPMPAGMERGTLIGKQGAYVQRLESKYDVRINFPRDDSPEENEIRFRGPKKGVDAAVKEIKDLIAFEKERGQSTTLTVSARAIPRILGKQGSKIAEIGSETGATIDVEKTDDQTGHVQIRGTKEAIAAAKKSIQEIAKDADDETTITFEVERSMHVTLIGKGGSNLRDLITRCGGPTDARGQGALIRFPRANDEGDNVTLRGPSELVNKLKAELDKEIAAIRNRVIYGVPLPRSAHANFIGRGGAGINALQTKHGIKIVMPSGRDSSSTGEPENLSDLQDVAPEDLVKLVGTRSACEAAATEIKGRFKAQPASAGAVTVEVPHRYHAAIADGGRFFRSLPPGVRVEHGNAKLPPRNSSRQLPPKPTNGAKSSAPLGRIDQDEDEETPSASFTWDVVRMDQGSSDDSPDIPWNVSGNNPENVAFAVKAIQDALVAARQDTACGYLTVPPSLMPRIVGKGGSGLERVRALGVKVETLGRTGSDTLTIVGTPEKIETARQLIASSVDQKPPGRGGRRRDDDY